MSPAVSIAPMPNRQQAKTPESLALRAARKRSGLSQAAVADHLGINASLPSQWETGGRPVPSDKAVAVGQLLGVEPAAISAAYRRLQQQGVVSDGRASTGQGKEDTLDRMLALDMAIGVLVAVMAEHRPAEARDVADAIRKKIPAQLREQGLFRELLSTLDGV